MVALHDPDRTGALSTEDRGMARLDAVRVAPGAFLAGALALVLLAACLNLLAIALQQRSGPAEADLAARLFLMDRERNVPTFLSFALIVFNAVMLAVLALGARSTRSRWRWHWAGLALLFLAMAFDEAAVLHEKLNGVFGSVAPHLPALRHAWVIPASAFVAALGLVMLPFVRAISPAERRLVILAGCLYVGGAIGVEMAGAALARAQGLTGLGYLLASTLEETLEMAGMALFGYALLRLLAEPDGSVALPRQRV
jgi:hypothetical protein